MWSVANPDLQIRGRGGHPHPEIRGGGGGEEDLAFFPLRSFFPTTFVYFCIENGVQIGGFYYMRLRFPRKECEFKKSAAYHCFVHLF